MRKILIAAADANWGIGLNGNLPWKAPADLKNFKARTMGGTLIVGRKTKDTLPPLPGRRVISVSRSGQGDYLSVEDVFLALQESGIEEVFLAGGGEIYKAGLPFVDTAEVTRINGVHACDAWMPNLGKFGWKIIEKRALDESATLETWVRNEY